MDNITMLRQAYANFATGNVPAVLDVFDPAIEWFECEGMPFVKDNGHYIGHDAIVQNVFMKIGDYIHGFSITVSDIFGAGDRVVMEGYYEGTYKPTGKKFKANAAHIWTERNGKLIRFFQAVDSAAITGKN